VRELHNLVERMMILSSSETLDEADVAEALPAPRAGTSSTSPVLLRARVADAERQAILEALERHRWKMAPAARELGVERSHLYKKVKALGIERPE
jgi:two-component system, NtrC family, nitrogen regulation response regulator NtrX